ncbi:MAG: hypothetical protein LBB56_01830, partial [Chitinispirillales bacterium]|nr:hypothetical protein [Chitinispirillales bacterium]
MTKLLSPCCIFKYLCLFAALLLCVCAELPEHCGDNNKFNSATQFCFGGETIEKCGNKEYDPALQGCVSGEILKRCSGGALVSLNTPCEAAAPEFTSQPQSGVVALGEVFKATVEASVTDGGILSYQWYSNTTGSNSGGTSIHGAAGPTYSMLTSTQGTFYYYAAVTNTNSNAAGNRTVTAVSDAVSVTVLVNAAEPKITGEPQDVSVEVGGGAELKVTAVSPDDGTLTYQWYRNETAVNVDGILIDGATESKFSPNTNATGTFYYYVLVSNVNTEVNGEQKTFFTSRPASVAVTEAGVVNAKFPDVSGPASVTVNKDGSVELSVTAVSLDGGTLSYQWYSSTTGISSGGTIIAGATGDKYSPNTDMVGTFYYYVVVTNTNNAASGDKTAVSPSSVATVTVKQIVNAAAPDINTHPSGGSVNEGGNYTISVAASVTDGGTLSYKWYTCEAASSSNCSEISGADSNSYSVSTVTPGTFYYYVAVTNTNNSANG